MLKGLEFMDEALADVVDYLNRSLSPHTAPELSRDFVRNALRVIEALLESLRENE